MRIFKHPNKVLTEPCLTVDILGSERSELVNWLIEFLEFYEACQKTPLDSRKMVGLAANQVGRSLRAFISQGQLYLNPVIVWKAQGQENWVKEGCFSIGGENDVYGACRAYGIRLKWQDINGEFHEKRFNGFPAQVIQHEFDHINSILLK